MMSHRVLARLIESDPAYAGEPIRLLSCNTGAEGATAAQNLANKLGREVLAPDNLVWAEPYPAPAVVAPPKVVQMPWGPVEVPDMSQPGRWVSFKPGGGRR